VHAELGWTRVVVAVYTARVAPLADEVLSDTTEATKQAVRTSATVPDAYEFCSEQSRQPPQPPSGFKPEKTNAIRRRRRSLRVGPARPRREADLLVGAQVVSVRSRPWALVLGYAALGSAVTSRVLACERVNRALRVAAWATVVLRFSHSGLALVRGKRPPTSCGAEEPTSGASSCTRAGGCRTPCPSRPSPRPHRGADDRALGDVVPRERSWVMNSTPSRVS